MVIDSGIKNVGFHKRETDMLRNMMLENTTVDC